jgi:hypothetical protein
MPSTATTQDCTAHEFGTIETGKFALLVRRCRRCRAVQTLRPTGKPTEDGGELVFRFKVIGQQATK